MPKTNKFCDFCIDQFGRKVPSFAKASGYCLGCERYIGKFAKTDADYATLHGIIKMRQFKQARETRRKNYEKQRAFRVIFKRKEEEEKEKEKDNIIESELEAERRASIARIRQMLPIEQDED